MQIRYLLVFLAWSTLVAGSVRKIYPQDTGAKLSQWSELPPLPPPETIDWLVSKVNRRAGLYRSASNEVALDNGLLRRSFRIAPNLATVGLDDLSTGTAYLRAVRPEARIQIGETWYSVGGLKGQAVENYLDPKTVSELSRDEDAFVFDGSIEMQSIRARLEWQPRSQWISRPYQWPPPGIEVRFGFDAPPNSVEAVRNLHVDVHYAIYDGVPLIEKWITVHNRGPNSVRLKSFVSEILACVEASSQVEDLADPIRPNLHIETDFTSVSMHGAAAQRDSVYWMPDPNYKTQVNYRLESRCLLECRPNLGPDCDLDPGSFLDSFRTWILVPGSRDEARQTLAIDRFYETVAPWTLENPLIHHVRNADAPSVQLAIEQCQQVGFELVIMTFGSGFEIENDSTAYLESIRQLAFDAHEKGIGLGGYSLLASRSIGLDDDVVNPETGKPGGFARFGNSPCLESRWGQAYFAKLQKFFENTRCDVLEHDGSYPGDLCASTTHPGHRDLGDSRWNQWNRIRLFYHWCRGRGIYLNVPDWYFLSGSNKTGMGYRETNWSLPREYQEIIERQNIYDGTRYKLPTMGWMFVPLTQYHGGGAAATIEPLKDHLDHYERRLQNLLGAGVQACFRGPRLYDSVETQEMVKRWVEWFKDHRAILESPLLGLRRPDGRDWDGWLHVDPRLATPAMAMIYNPLEQPLERTLSIPLHYAGLSHTARVAIGSDPPVRIDLDQNDRATLSLTIPARSAVAIAFTQ